LVIYLVFQNYIKGGTFQAPPFLYIQKAPKFIFLYILLSLVYGRSRLTKETPEGSVFELTLGKAPEGRPQGRAASPLHHPGGVDLYI
jgi:hypothetical protein